MAKRVFDVWSLIGRMSKVVGLLVALGVIAGSIIEFVDMRNEIRNLQEQLDAAREKETRLYALLLDEVKAGRVTKEQLVSYLSADQVQGIAGKAELQPTMPFDINTQFFPSGFMGDGESGAEYLSLTRSNQEVRGSLKTVLRFEYRRGPKRWAGIYWQHPDGNWGDKPGKSLVGARFITFLAKGDEGGEIVEFKAGGIVGRRYADSFEVTLGPTVLANDWTEYRIDLDGRNLSSVIGGFAWSAVLAENERNLAFCITNLRVNP